MTRNFKSAFTIIEMLVVLFIIGILTTTLVLNFRTNGTGKTARLQTASVIVSDIRKMQVMAISGATYQDADTCGFGVHFEDATHYTLYARLAGSGPCKTDPRSRTYEASDPKIEEKKSLVNDKMEMSLFPDIFFELPDPTTYIDNSTASGNVATILVSASSVPAETTSIEVSTSGRIDLEQ